MSCKVGMISLGCPKNQVDAEHMLARLHEGGYYITNNESSADVVIINTCGFIDDAKKEAIENILEMAALKKEGTIKGIIVTGCLAERFRDEVAQELPEVNVVLGLGSSGDICAAVEAAYKGEHYSSYGDLPDMNDEGERVLTTPRYTAYLRIADGCDNCCTYCTIPHIRGRFRSRTVENIVNEAKRLAARGVKELVVVAQDTTRYGDDLYGEVRLCELLDKLCEIDGIQWIRMLYTYPDRITDKLLDTMARQPKILNYLDIPLQHCNGDILRRMNRRGDRASLTALMEKIRKKLPDVTLRTTFITGFPGETEEQFTELCEFVRQVEFDRLGCFAYSAEEGTPAAEMDNQVDEEVKQRRADIIMDIQNRIVDEKNQRRIGDTVDVLVEGYDSYIKCFFGRSPADAPDIDAKVFFCTDGERPAEGDIVPVEITDTIEYDLLGCMTDNQTGGASEQCDADNRA